MSANQLTPDNALRITRLLWAAMIVGQMIFLAVIALLIGNQAPSPVTPLRFAPFIMLTIMVPAGYFVRSQIYKRHWQGDVITPQGYITGNLILLAMCEGVSFFSMVVVMISGEFIPAILPAVIAMGVQVINFPHGRPMHPDPTVPQPFKR